MNLNQITLTCSNLSDSVAFYEKLGLELIVLSEPRYARFLCPEGDATFSLHHEESYKSNGHNVIYFECRDLDSKVRELKEKGLSFDMDPVDQSWLWREALLLDPDGNKIKLYYAGENRIDPPWRINKKSRTS